MIRVLIVAPASVMRAGLRTLLAADEIEVVGEAASLTDLAHLPRDADVVVLADEAVFEDVEVLLTGDEHPAVIVLSDDPRFVGVLQALELAGWGVLPEETSAAELQAAVTVAAQGMVVLPRAIAGQLLSQPRGSAAVADLPVEPLTAREREVLELLSQGLSNKLIARALQISEHTVKYHVSSIFAKLNASSRTDAVSRAARQGLIAL